MGRSFKLLIVYKIMFSLLGMYISIQENNEKNVPHKYMDKKLLVIFSWQQSQTYLKWIGAT